MCRRMYESGADIVKIATMAGEITDAAAMLSLLQDPVGEVLVCDVGIFDSKTRGRIRASIIQFLDLFIGQSGLMLPVPCAPSSSSCSPSRPVLSAPLTCM